jgi:hypothetical protein
MKSTEAVSRQSTQRREVKIEIKGMIVNILYSRC